MTGKVTVSLPPCLCLPSECSWRQLLELRGKLDRNQLRMSESGCQILSVRTCVSKQRLLPQTCLPSRQMSSCSCARSLILVPGTLITDTSALIASKSLRLSRIPSCAQFCSVARHILQYRFFPISDRHTIENIYCRSCSSHCACL